MGDFIFYILGAVLSFAFWIVALLRLKKVFTGTTSLLVGKVLMIVTLMIVDFLIVAGFFQWVNREQFRMGMTFLTGVQIVAAIGVATGKQKVR